MSNLELKVGDVLVAKNKVSLHGVKVGDSYTNLLEKTAEVTVTQDNIILLRQLRNVFEVKGAEVVEKTEAEPVVEKKARAPRKPKQKTADVATVV